MSGLWIVSGLSIALAVGAAADTDAEQPPLRIGNDTYMSGRDIAMRAPAAGDAVIAGGRVVLSGDVGGDALVAGGSVRIDSNVGQDLYAAGGDLSVTGSVGDSARLAGGRVTLAPDAVISGSLTAAGGSVTLDGHVHGDALVSAGRVRIDGRIDGNLRVVGGELTLGPAALVQGRLDYHGAEPLQMSPGAQLQGGVSETAPPDDGAAPTALLIVWLAGWIVAAAVLLTLAPQATRRVTRALRDSPVAAPLLGLALLAGLPLLVVLLIVTVIGIPLGLLALFVLLALIPLGFLVTAMALGDSAFERRAPAKTGLRTVGASLALILLFALAQLPWVGWLVWLLAPLAGVGAIGLSLAGVWRRPVA